MKQEEPKSRHEMKYLISAAQITILKSRINNLMKRDSHVSADGCYNVRSLYFDDYYNRCFYENENGTEPREKYRIRIYNHSSERIQLECKRKEHGKTMKTSCALTREQAEKLIQGYVLPQTEILSPLLRKFMYEMQSRRLHPVIIVEYERIPFVYKNGNVRLTFDTNISSSSEISDFFLEKLPKRPIMPVGQHLMEVKYDEYLPDVIYRSLNLNQLQLTTYSKYYLCRKYNLY